MNNIFFKWDKDLVTGINAIDTQHRGLIEIINTSLQLCFNNETISEAVIEDIYNKLQLYITQHFKTEEQLMKQFDVDSRHLDMHIALHNEFKETVANLFYDFSILVNPEKLGFVTEYLVRWLAYHILNTDKSLVRQIILIRDKEFSPELAFDQEVNFIESSTEPLLKALRSLFYLVSEKNKALTQANFELEEKIQSRTSELLDANKKLNKILMQDELTGLSNRRYAIHAIEQSIYNWKRYGLKFSLLFIDVDKFKAVNDNFGHEYGDKVLKWLSDFLRSNLRENDIPCRLGGDEFLIICNNCDAKNALSIGYKINKECKSYNLQELNGCWVPSLSIGIAEVSENCESTNDILRNADSAMYISKQNGGDQTTLAND